MLNLIYLAYAFARSAALWIILFTSTATIALLYSSLPRRSEEGLQSSDANCAACAMADSVSSLPKRACSDRGCTQWGRVHIGEPDANGCAYMIFIKRQVDRHTGCGIIAHFSFQFVVSAAGSVL